MSTSMHRRITSTTLALTILGLSVLPVTGIA